MSNIETLKKIKQIIEIEEVFLTDQIKEKISPGYLPTAMENEKNLFAYRMTYMSDGRKVVGYIVEPRTSSGEDAEGRLPCIVYNRGGSNEFGEIKRGWLFSHLAEFALRGYVLICSQYSGNAGGEGKDEFGGADVHDVETLYELLKEYKRADTTRIGMYGASRGGMMTYLMLARVSWIKAAVVVGALADLFGQEKMRPPMIEHYKSMFGGGDVEKEKRSALRWADKISKTTPLLIMHGWCDWRVDPLDSVRMAEKLYENKVPHRLVMFEGNDHGLSESGAESDTMAFVWLDRFVKNKEAPPVVEPHGK